MSVLNQSGDEQVECPLCMEPLEMDDLSFYPCTCLYQICRFCWHRIRTDENGLCPACRKAYSENPADFVPLSKEQIAKQKAEKRQRDQQRKAKLTESRKHLASVRVVQRNLVFVVGLPMRLADPEVLKKYEYFGKFGKIHKVVINQSTSYAGTQGPSASAYVTYMKSDDALKAIQHVNNTIMDGKTIKTSLGTTKYCSYFMKNQPCPKPDCMYLHDFGDQEASFTKEQMHAGKHQEYEKKLHDALNFKLAQQSANPSTVTPPETQKVPAKLKEIAASTQSTNKENWPQLNNGEKMDKKEKEKAEKDKKGKKTVKNGSLTSLEKKLEKKTPPPPTENEVMMVMKEKYKEELFEENNPLAKVEESVIVENHKLPILDDNSSFFSQNNFLKIAPEEGEDMEQINYYRQQTDPFLDINDTDSWEFDFGYSKHLNHLEELAKQRVPVKEEYYGNNFNTLEHFGKIENAPSPFGRLETYNTENMLETLAKNSVNYAQTMQSSVHAPYNGVNKELNGVSNLDQHMSKFFSDFCRNGFNQQPQPLSPNLHARENLSMTQLRDGINGGLSQNINVNGVNQQNGYHHHNQPHLNMADKHTLALLQQQRQIEEQLLNLGISNKQQTLQHNGHIPVPVNSQMEIGQYQNVGPFGNSINSNQMFGNSAISNGKNRIVPEEKELDYRFQETQKALEELLGSDSHMHNTGRSNVGSNQINGLVHSQSGSHLPPPPPGFVQPTTHMNSFGSKILPFLNMNSQQQQQISSQNNWPNNYGQVHQQNQQPQQNKGMGVCNDWKFLDPAILSSRRHIPNMNPLLDQYPPSPLPPLGSQSQSLQNGPPPPRQFEGYNGFTNYNPVQQNMNNYSHIASQQNLNWLGNELNSQLSTPPGFRTSGQATKQQEC